MGDINNSHGGGGATAGATFPVAMYVLFFSFLALLLVPFSDLLDVLSLMYMVKYVSANVILFPLIKLTQKLLNNLTLCTANDHLWHLQLLSVNNIVSVRLDRTMEKKMAIQPCLSVRVG